MIRIKQLHKRFGKQPVLNGIDLDFSRAGITAILGPNGSGKTTLIKCLLGMVLPTDGSIHIREQDIKGQWAYRDQVSYLPQIARFPENMKVCELLNLLKGLRQRESAEEQLIELFGLQPFLNKRLGTLSGGTRQKVNLVQAFMYDNPILVLDEPTSGLDPVALLKLKDWILQEKAKGKMILITTHIMGFVEEMADEIVFLLDGSIHFRGSQGELLEKYREDKLERAIAALLEGKPFIEKTERPTDTKDLKIAAFSVSPRIHVQST